MSTAVQKAGHLKPEVRLGQAISEFEYILSDAEKSRFRAIRTALPPAPPDVMKLTEEIDAENSRRRRRCIGPRLTSILQAIQQFAPVIDTVIGSSRSQIAGAIWAVVKTTLSDAAAPRYQELGYLFPTSGVRRTLCQYFIPMVGLCKQSVLFLRKSSFKQLSQSIVSSFDAQFGHFEVELSVAAQSLREEVSVAAKREQRLEQKENSTFRSHMTKRSEVSEKRRQLKNKLRFLNACSTYDYQAPWKAARKAGSSHWLYDKDAYQHWLHCPSGALWCTGILGSGKTVLAASLVQHLIVNEHTPTAIVGYFFCKHSDEASLTTRTILGTLAKQMLESAPEEIFDAVPYWWVRPVPEDTLMLYLRTFTPLHKQVQTYYLVIDGLDDYRNEELMLLMPCLRQLLGLGNVRLFLTSRLDTYQWMSPHIMPHLQVAMDVSADLEQYIETELEDRLQSGYLALGDPKLVIAIRDELISGSKGMFLWVAFQLESICAESTDSGIMHALQSLPKSLPETFGRILRNLEKATAPDNQAVRRKMFEIMSAAQCPLTMRELREALSVVPGNLDWDHRRLINDMQRTFNQQCGSLAVIDEEDNTATFAHPSIKQYLLSSAASYGITLSKSNLYLGELCVTYLNFPVHETQLVKRKLKRRNLQPTDIPTEIISSQLSRYTAVNAVAIKLLKSTRNQIRDEIDIDLFGWTDPIVPNTPAEPHSKYAFLSCATKHWPAHSSSFTLETPSFGLFCRLLNGDVSFIPQPWIDCKIIYYDAAVENPLLWAAATGHEAATRFLLDCAESKADAKDTCGRSPLSWAVEGGHETVVKLLLSTQKVNIDSKTMLGCTPLMFAAGRGHFDVVKLLLDLGADPNAKDHVGRTPLSVAAAEGREAVLRLLLETPGVEADHRDRHGRTPLSGAAEYGYENVVRMFLQRKDVDIASRDENGKTPYSHALQIGHVAVAQLLASKMRSLGLHIEGDEGLTRLDHQSDE
ncbi:hypothetical protein H2200_012482 [Cladophialophora chaetospira]|uniref:Nephrocystin 3-like N-terminal domain-containing protein n=1 Tax=Cladophialophora chaetospira TaxID=386627 RepID=A0AA39CCF5_9EURO|nr:hypothetical protein H2200_012482 [Cladophialophora chaetospira]